MALAKWDAAGSSVVLTGASCAIRECADCVGVFLDSVRKTVLGSSLPAVHRTFEAVSAFLVLSGSNKFIRCPKPNLPLPNPFSCHLNDE